MRATLFQRIASWLRGARKPPQAAAGVSHADRTPVTHFIYIKIPEPLMPLDRGSKYEDPIDGALSALQLGSVSGGGAQLGDERPDGTRPIEFCGIDVDAKDLDKARAELRAILVKVGAPVGTEIHYSIGDEKWQDELRADGWTLQQPRTFLHPGFGS